MLCIHRLFQVHWVKVIYYCYTQLSQNYYIHQHVWKSSMYFGASNMQMNRSKMLWWLTYSGYAWHFSRNYARSGVLCWSRFSAWVFLNTVCVGTVKALPPPASLIVQPKHAELGEEGQPEILEAARTKAWCESERIMKEMKVWEKVALVSLFFSTLHHFHEYSLKKNERKDLGKRKVHQSIQHNICDMNVTIVFTTRLVHKWENCGWLWCSTCAVYIIFYEKRESWRAMVKAL